MRFPMVCATLAAGLLVACAPSAGQQPVPVGQARLEPQTSGTTQLLQAVSVVDSMVVWVSGHGGTWGRTLDGGRTWATAVVPGSDSLQFRDVHAASATTAWLLSAGSGPLSRIYRTDDAGRTWTRQFLNEEPEGFYDCMDFWDERRGFVYGDAVGGTLRVLVTDDGGATWRLVPSGALPAALPGEGGFAASGTCAIAGANGRGWIAAGNAPTARVFLTTDYGRSWSPSVVQMAVSGEASGLASISMVDDRLGTAFGGNIGTASSGTDKVVRTQDGGRTWSVIPSCPVRTCVRGGPVWTGAVYGGVHVPGTGTSALIAVGPGGADVSTDGGATWRTMDPQAWWGVGSGGPDASWITGPGGRIARVRMRAPGG